jgi:CRISPR/Cas system CMR subunit Cmr4 (Cas7 group RAMP superfamily)
VISIPWELRLYVHTPDDELQMADMLVDLLTTVTERFKEAVKNRDIVVAEDQLKYIIENAQEIVRRLKLARDGETSPGRRSLENGDKSD